MIMMLHKKMVLVMGVACCVLGTSDYKRRRSVRPGLNTTDREVIMAHSNHRRMLRSVGSSHRRLTFRNPLLGYTETHRRGGPSPGPQRDSDHSAYGPSRRANRTSGLRFDPTKSKKGQKGWVPFKNQGKGGGFLGLYNPDVNREAAKTADSLVLSIQGWGENITNLLSGISDWKAIFRLGDALKKEVFELISRLHVVWKNKQWLEERVADGNFIENIQDLRFDKNMPKSTALMHKTLFFYFPFIMASYPSIRGSGGETLQKIRGYTLENSENFGDHKTYSVYYRDSKVKYRDPDDDNKVKTKICRKVIIGFRGTVNLMDCVMDLSLVLGGLNSIFPKVLRSRIRQIEDRANKKYQDFQTLCTNWKGEISKREGEDVKLEITSIHVCGHSLGGEIASRFAALLLKPESEFRGKFKGAIVHNPAIIGWICGESKRWTKQILDEHKRFIVLANHGDPLTQRLQHYLAKEPKKRDNIFIVKKRGSTANNVIEKVMKTLNCHMASLPWTHKDQTEPCDCSKVADYLLQEQEFFDEYERQLASRPGDDHNNLVKIALHARDKTFRRCMS